MPDPELDQIPEVPARLAFMGGQTSQGWARVLQRTPAWRRSQIIKDLLLLLLVPVVVFIPPHVPWPLVVIAVACIRAFNHSREYRTLKSLRGPCPKCDFDQEYRELGRMGNPHKVQCANCRWDLYVEVPHASEVTGRAPGETIREVAA
jgi:hypothetical protein